MSLFLIYQSNYICFEHSKEPPKTYALIDNKEINLDFKTLCLYSIENGKV